MTLNPEPNRGKQLIRSPFRKQAVAISAAIILAVQPGFGDTSKPIRQPAPWKQNQLLRTFWCEPPAEDKQLAALATEHFNLTWCPASALDTVARHNLRGMIHDETILKPFVLDNPAKKKLLDAMIAKVRNNSALECYWLADEPKQEQFKDLARLVNYLKQLDPAHFSYINVLPIYAFSEQGYVEYLREFFKVVRPQCFTFAHYPFFKTHDGLQYFQNLEVIRRESKTAGVPFIGIIQACTYDKTWRLPTSSELRWFVYTNLAYGSKGISYFLYWGPKAFGGLYQDGRPTPLLAAAVQLNAEIEAMSNTLLPLASKAVYHTSPLPLGTQPVPANCPVKITDRGHGQFMLAFFDAPGGAQYVMVVNRDYKTARTVALQVPNGSLKQEFDRRTTRLISAPSRDWFGIYKINLAAGDGRLFTLGK